MSVAAVQEAIRLVRENPDRCRFVGERDEAMVDAAESALGLTMPESYRAFVRVLGAGNVGASEVFGVTTAEFIDSTVPSGVWLTLEARRDWGLPDSMIVIYFDGGVDYFVLDVAKSERGGEPPVEVWRPGVSSAADRLARVDEDFGSFFLDLVRKELGAD